MRPDTAQKSEAFGKNSLHDILRNEKYIGIYVYRKTSPTSSRVAADPLATMKLDGAIPRILDDEVFNQVQDILDNRKVRTRTADDTVYILSGIARCGECGQAMAGNSYVSKGRKYYYYRCNNAARTHGQACSHTKKYNKASLETEVIAEARKALVMLRESADQIIDQVYSEVLVQSATDTEAKRILLADLKKTQTAMENLVNSIAAGVDPTILAPKINELGKKKDSLSRRIKRLEANQITREEIEGYVNDVIAMAIDPGQPEACRADLRAIFGEITITPQRPLILSFKRLNSWVLMVAPRGIEPLSPP